MPDFLDIGKESADSLRGILDQARDMKEARRGKPKAAPDAGSPLEGHVVALVFEKPSTRTRVSFDVGVRQLGGQPLVLDGSALQLGQGEAMSDTARVLSRYVDLIMIRTFDEASLFELARHSSVPVINGLTDSSHPCQIMADVMTYEERRGSIKGAKVVWLGDGNNVCNSYIEAAAAFSFDFTFCGPETLFPEPARLDAARERGAKVNVHTDPAQAVSGADLVVTDTWLSMHDDQASRDRRHNQLMPYQVNRELMERAGPEAIFMHCLPAHREEEVTSEVMDGPQSAVFDEAENRLHVQKAIMRRCLGV